MKSTCAKISLKFCSSVGNAIMLSFQFNQIDDDYVFEAYSFLEDISGFIYQAASALYPMSGCIER